MGNFDLGFPRAFKEAGNYEWGEVKALEIRNYEYDYQNRVTKINVNLRTLDSFLEPIHSKEKTHQVQKF